MDALNNMVEHYNEAIDEYEAMKNGEGEEWVYQMHYNNIYNRILKSRCYHSLVRSSIASFFTLNERSKLNFMKEGVKAYFEAHGGYENAHKANWTVLKAPK